MQSLAQPQNQTSSQRLPHNLFLGNGFVLESPGTTEQTGISCSLVQGYNSSTFFVHSDKASWTHTLAISVPLEPRFFQKFPAHAACYFLYLLCRCRTSIKIRYNNSVATVVPLCALNTFENRREPEDVVVTGEAGW